MREKKFAGKKQPSMLRRCEFHDYRSRSMYMITMTTIDRLPFFGTLIGDASLPFGSVNAPRIQLSEIGEVVVSQWRHISDICPQIETLDLQMMPDHLHGILFVKEHIDIHLSNIINGFKIGCRREAARYLDAKASVIFSHGYNDRILFRESQLEAWRNYLRDNPRRLLMKRQYPEYFRIQRNVDYGGFSFSAQGNIFLLDYPDKLAVQCSRRMTAGEIECEKAIMKAAFEEGYPEIILKEDGFGELAKPGGRSFDACAKGLMLFLSPWEHHNERKMITRSQCLSLNDIAKAICI